MVLLTVDGKTDEPLASLLASHNHPARVEAIDCKSESHRSILKMCSLALQSRIVAT
jgi:hypothetical protein